MGDVLLEVKNLKKYFKTPRGLLHAVDDVSFTLERGKTLGIVGESGCGKSTTGRLINHLLTPDSGEIWFMGKEISRISQDAMRPLRKDMQMIFQDPAGSLDPRMRVAELIEEPLLIHTDMSAGERMKVVNELLGIVGLALLPVVMPASIMERFLSIGDLTDTSSSYRLLIYLGTLGMLKDYWFSGIGPGMEAFNQVYPAYAYHAVSAPHSHNLFLQLTSDTGIFGMGVFCLVIFSFYRTCFTALRGERDFETRVFIITGISAVSGFMVQSMTDYTFYNYRVMLLFWAVLALGLLFTRCKELKGANNG